MELSLAHINLWERLPEDIATDIEIVERMPRKCAVYAKITIRHVRRTSHERRR